ncbi:MAG: GNAT family N-acetyltransferase [Thermoguttaceae bacterium]|jgi:predicted N-acyltransferase|nr:GNAT family N-acetyltransferase [Thermoguttaceae bacterium]
MPYKWRIYSSMDEVDRQAWEAVHASSGDLFSDPRFISAVEHSMVKDTQCWPVVVEDDTGRPAAITCFSLHQVDGALLIRAWLSAVVQFVRRVWPGYFRFRVLFCGLPVSAGQKTLCIAPHAEPGQVIEALDSAISELAGRLRVGVIVWKEFGPADCQWLASLERRGYVRADSLPMCYFDARFGDFDAYQKALKWNGRHNIRRSQRKFRKARLRIARMHGDEGFDRLYTDEVHRLYEAIHDHAQFKLERLPAEFFREIARQFGRDARFSVAYQGERVVAFLCSLADKQQFCLLFMGMDYAVNRECDLYFNLMYDGLDCGLRSGAARISFGQNSYTFKARLGCREEPRVFFIRGRRLLGLALRMCAHVLFPPVGLSTPPDVFRTAEPLLQPPAQPAMKEEQPSSHQDLP